MSQSVIGALRVNLGLDSAKFERGAKRVNSPLADMKKQFVAVAMVAAAAGAAISAMALAGARDLDKAAKSARRLGASIGAFRALELAADEAGVSLSSLTNDIQTIDREIAAIGVSGNAKRALDALNLSVEDLSGTDADEKLAIIADRVKALGLTTGEASAVLRDLGVRNREMVLLMINGGDAIRGARQDIEDYGLAVSGVDAAKIETANDAISRLALIGKYAGQQLALELVPAMGKLARAMTESLREGGILRGVIDGLANNMQRLMTYVAVAVSGFGARYVGALIAARIATATLSGSLLFLRGALIATGIGALIVGAGELVYQFTKLVKGAGGFGNALALLKNVAGEVWSRMGMGASSMGASLSATWDTVAGGFLSMLSTLQDRWATFLRNLAGAVKDVPGFGDMALDLHGASVEARSGSYETSQSSDDHFGSADQARARADALARAAERPLSSIEALREAFRKAREETDGASDAADRFNTALGNLGEGGTGGVNKAKDAVKDLAEEMQSVKSTAKSAFAGMVTGAKSLKDAVADVASSLATMFANRAFESLFGSLFPSIPGHANGTMSAAGGLAMVGERGPELVNLPRGSQVINAQKTKGMFGGGGKSVLRVELGDGVKAQVLSEAQDQSIQIMSSGLEQFERSVLPRSVRAIQADPRKIG